MDWIKKITGMASKSPPSTADQWQAEYQRQPGGLAPLLSPQFNPLSRWPPKQAPARLVDFELGLVLKLRYVKREAEVCASLSDRALAIAQRVRDEGLCDNLAIPAMCHLQLDRAEAYLRWIATGQLDLAKLERAYDAAAECIQSAEDNYFEEGFALSAARIALVMQRSDWVRPVLSRIEQWKHPASAKMRDALDGLADLACLDPPLRQARILAFDGLFDLYRSPYPDKALTDVQGSLSTARFELAVIREQIRSETGFVDLQTVFDSVVA